MAITGVKVAWQSVILVSVVGHDDCTNLWAEWLEVGIMEILMNRC